MKLVHNSPYGVLDIIGVGIVRTGDIFEVPAPFGRTLLQQADLYQTAEKAVKPKPVINELKPKEQDK